MVFDNTVSPRQGSMHVFFFPGVRKKRSPLATIHRPSGTQNCLYCESFSLQEFISLANDINLGIQAKHMPAGRLRSGCFSCSKAN